MRELSDDEVFGSTKELSDADVFGPQSPSFKDNFKQTLGTALDKLGNDVLPRPLGDALLAARGKVREPEGYQSVMQTQPADTSLFNFRDASALRRSMSDAAERESQYGTVGPIVGPKATAGSIVKGLGTDLVAGGKGARAGINQMVGDLVESEYLQNQARKERGQADLMTAVNTPEFESDTARGVYGGLSSMVRQAPALAAAIATRSPSVALGGMAAPMLPEEYGKFRQRGGTPMESLAGAAGMTGAEVATEMLPMGFLVKQFGRAGAGQFLTGMLAREVPSEQAATLAQDAIDTAVANPDKTWGQYLQERPGAAYQTLIATLTQSGIMGAGNAAVNRLSKQPEAPQDVIGKLFGQQTEPAQPVAQPTPQAAAPQAAAPAPQDQAALADRIIAAMSAGQPELSDAEVFDNATPDQASFIQADQAPSATAEAPQPEPAAMGELGALDVAAQPEQADALTDAPILQNRNRATPSSIAQMQSIAGNPDYGRLGFSRDFANGAPVVAGGQIAPEQLGKADVAVASDGRRIPVQYAVVEAADVLASNQSDGTPNKDYGNQAVQRIRAIAGNGRIAGLQAAHRNGTTKAYLDELASDTLHGVSPEVIRAMRAPVLVRVMPNEAVTADIGDVSNTVGNLELSPVEQANNDAQRVRLDALQFAEDGGITPETVRQFVRAMPQAEQGGLIDTNGQPTKQAVDRISAAVFAKAYGNDQLVRLFAQAQDPEARNVLSALAQVAPKMARLEDAGALDIRDVVTQAAEIAVNARREGISLQRAAQQIDMTADPLVAVVLDLFARNPRSTKAVVESLGNMADLAYTEATKPAEDMFGEVPRANRDQVINTLRPQDEQTSQENLEQPAGREPVQVNAGGTEAQPAAQADAEPTQASGPAQDEGLTSYTAQEIEQRQAQQEQADAERKRQDREADQRAQADAERDTFTLTGSDRTADVAAAQGQEDIFSAAAEDDTPTGKIEDLGEKIGGARKDTAGSTGSTGRKKTKDERPAWARRFEVSEIVAGDNEGRWTIHDTRTKDFMGRPKQVGGRGNTYATEQEALDAVPLAAVSMKHRAVPTGTKNEKGEYSYEIWRDISDRKRVKVVDQVFPSRIAALEYMAKNAQAILETNTTFGEADLPRPDNTNRTGATRRTGDVKGSDFMDTFGFRGVEFGNWNNQNERQEVMNAAYDGLMDLAEVMGIPPKAIGLNGDLALAFGARGQGLSSAVAHYERARSVINLTKMNGAGALAHEWFHALDHYFGRQDGKASSTWKVGEDGTRTFDIKGAEGDMASGGFKYMNSGVRQEMRDAYQNVMDTMFSKAEQYVEDTAKADKFVAASREGVAERLDKLRKDLSEQKDVRYYKRNNKPASAEQLAEFDTIAKQIVAGESLEIGLVPVEGSKSLNGNRWSNEALEKLSAIYKAVRGRSGFGNAKSNGIMDDLRGDMTRYSQRLKMLAEAQAGSEKTKRVPTEFAMNAKELDQGRGENYWTTPHEMAARAFQGYVEDKIAAQGARSPFLNYAPENAGILTPWGAKRPFPHGKERKAINEAFDAFVEVLDTKETEQGVMLFDLARRQQGNPLDRLTDSAKANVTKRLASLEKTLGDGKITDEQFAEGAQAVLEQVAQVTQRKVNRGPEWIQERLIRAKRKGELEADTVDFALWALAKNPAMATELAVLVSDTKEPAAGDYNPATETMRLFKSTASETTAVHEILHHTERMMPPEVQAGILREYNKAWGNAYNKGNAKIKGLMRDMLMAAAGDKKAMERVVAGFEDGTLDYETHYALFNASEFWAVNAADILSKRYAVQGSWVAQAKQWLRELIQFLKGKLGMPSDAPILKALEAVLKGDGTKFSKDVLANTESLGEMQRADTLRDIPKNQKQSPNRDALGRVKFRLGEVALGKLDAATRPLQERFGMRMASPELRRQLRKMKATIENANRSAANVAQQMKDMSEADRAMVSDIVEKMIAPGVVPPEHAIRVADAITKTMDRQTDELVALGMLSKDSADRWRGRYLPRIYNRKTELGIDSAMDAVKNMFKNGRPNMQGIGGGSLKGRGLFEDVSVDSVDQWLAMGYEVRDPNWKVVQGKLELVDKNAPKIAQEQVTVWRDWTPEERAQMGENRDALFRYVQGYTNMQRDIALGRLFNQIANNPDFVRRSGSDGWVQVPNTEIPDTGGVKRYGNLAGLYVRQDVMSHLSQFEESANDALQLWRDTLGIWKEGKTALNPVAHFNNVASNISMSHFAGVSYWDGHKYVAAVRDLVNNAPMVDEAREVGLFTGSFTKEELKQNMPPELQAMMNMEEGKLRKAGGQVMTALTFWLRKPLRDAYEFEDTFFKYLIYRDARQQGMSPEAASDYALKYIFTYDDLPKGARIVRDSAIPFFSWTYKAVPALLHTAMVYPWRLLAPAAVLNSINLVAYALAAGDEDDDWLAKLMKGRELEKEERKVLPDRMKGTGMLLNPKSIRLGTDSVTGHPIYLDASRVVPGGDMFDMENQAGGLPIPAPLMPNHPVLSAFSAMVANKELFMGKEVVDKNDTGLEAAEKRAKWMAGFILPAVAPGGYHSQRILDATANAMDTVIQTPLGEFTGVDKSGQPVQPKYAAMQTLGIKARPVDLELEESRRKAQENALVNSIAAEVRSMAKLRQKGAVSDDMMDRTREKAREKIERMRDKED